MPSAHDSRRSILEDLADRSGVRPRVSLPDSDSEHGSSPVVDPAAPATRLVPEGRGNYKLLGQIARGGMSVILKGHDTDLGRDIAVKVLDPSLAKRPEVVQRFVEEAQIGGQLQHPGIVPVYELGLMVDDRPYFTMKLVKGRTLAALFRQRSTPREDRGRLLGIFHATCQTVAYAHSKNVIHRDLKPANIMVGAFGEVQVVDWGLAKVLGSGGIEDERLAKDSCAAKASVAPSAIETVRSGPGSVGSDSMVGSVMGTPAYMPPEQAQGETEKLDERADVFALGAVLCELLTGAPPYDDRSEDSIVVQAARADLDRARTRLAECGVDPALVSLCLDCLRPARAARPANADAVANAIGDYLASTEARAQKAELAAAEARVREAEERRRRRLTVALASAIAVALIAGWGTFQWIQRSETERQEMTRVAVEEAHAESLEASREGRADASLSAALRALSLAVAGSAEKSLVARAEEFVDRAKSEVVENERVREQAQRDERLLERLETLRLGLAINVDDEERDQALDRAFANAFNEYGVDLEADDLLPALDYIEDREIGEEVALSLDAWVSVRHGSREMRSEGPDPLFYLAMDLDPDPERIAVREAIAERNLDTLMSFAESDRLERLDSSTIQAIAWAIWDIFPGQRAEVYRIAERVVPLHPNDYMLQSMAGRIFRWAGRWEDAILCRSAALAVRPDDALAIGGMAELYLFLGRLLDCERLARLAGERYPEDFDVAYMHAMALIQLGRYSEALPPLRRCRDIKQVQVLNDRQDVEADLLWTRYFMNVADRQEVLAALSDPADALGRGTLAFALVHHPDASAEDALRVLEEFKVRREDGAPSNWVWLVEALAYVVLEDWEAAASSLEGKYGYAGVAFMAPPAVTYLRSFVDSKLGRDVSAAENFDRAAAEARILIRSSEPVWEGSDLFRWRDRARAELSR